MSVPKVNENYILLLHCNSDLEISYLYFKNKAIYP